MRKVLASLAATAVLVGGGIAMVGVTADSAVAQESELSTVRPDRPLQTALDELVAEGVLTQGQADAVLEKLAENFDGRRHGRHPVRRGIGIAADVIGITGTELASELVDGSSIADVAEANDVDPQDVIDALVGRAEERLATAVENGRIDEATADERLADVEQKVTDFVNGDLDLPDPGSRGQGHGEPADEDASFSA